MPDRRIYRTDGELVDPFDVTPEDITLSEIARRLARRYRFAAASPWTVAEHCLAAAAWAEADNLPEAHCRCALLHDAAEAWLGDVPRPMKAGLRFGERSYEEAETAILNTVAEVFGYRNIQRIARMGTIGLIDDRLCEIEAAFQFGRLTVLTRTRFLAILDPHALRRGPNPPPEDLIVATFLQRAVELGMC